MSKPITFGRLDFEIVSSMKGSRGRPDPESPFRIVLLGDFSGRANRGIFQPGSALAGRRPIPVDRDNLDQAMAGMGTEIRLTLGGKEGLPINISFDGLDDFHPDRVFERGEIFKALRETRRRLKDPSTFREIVAKCRQTEGSTPLEKPGETSPEKTGSAPDMPPLSSRALLDEVLDATERGDWGSGGQLSDWDRFLHEIVKPHLVSDIEPKQAEFIEAVDDVASGLMRMILRHPDFQAVEAAWRGVDFLVRSIETDSRLKVYLLDISKDELAADLRATEDLRSTGAYKLLVEQSVETFGGEPWAVQGGIYSFEDTAEDAELLGRMGKIAGQSGAPFLSAAHDHLLGCDALADTPDPHDWRRAMDAEAARAWEALRRLPEAAYIGLALPRFLLRLPYGTKADPTEQFAFEEMPEGPVHEHYLWGNPCFGCVCLLAQAFSVYGWDLRPGMIQDMEGLPLHVYEERGESLTKPCAEVLLSDRVAGVMMDRGLMSFLSMKDRDVIRLARFQSLADPPTGLAGPWV